jgi:hypothetical protein
VSTESERFGLALAVASALAAILACSTTPQPALRAARPVRQPGAAPVHPANFAERHAVIAASDSAACGRCHAEDECSSCHDGRVRPRSIHPNDFLSLHAQAARSENSSCSSCHHAQSFCVSCHQRVGVAESGPTANYANRGRFHPPSSVWSSGARTAQHHAWEAQRNPSACVSCHTERDCIACHATRQLGGPGSGLPAGVGRTSNPHPAGFASRCGGALRDNARPCLVCHDPADPLLTACR